MCECLQAVGDANAAIAVYQHVIDSAQSQEPRKAAAAILA